MQEHEQFVHSGVIQQRHLGWDKNYIRRELQHLQVLVYEPSNVTVAPRGHQITNHKKKPKPKQRNKQTKNQIVLFPYFLTGVPPTSNHLSYFQLCLNGISV